ncbi:phosphatidylinositol synthase [Perkinsela sp. CCAP 1560/4]|nr:phosphatidylinositol synthase [Perkinsela sp. CCAP 1560/4]|eukprot:KNH07391.1 phosphatidylinositol synthase [Perkinsela sp. CCAP 1560/4]
MYKVLFFWPNIIGYIRVFLLAFAFSKAIDNPNAFAISYILALALDGLDGFLARRLNQCSFFGAVLDMMCDRTATCGLIIVLVSKYPSLVTTGIFLIALDFVSHYVRMCSTMSLKKSSHKDLQGNSSLLLQLYYQHKWIMCVTYAAQELWYLSMYLKTFPITNGFVAAVLSSRTIMANIFGLFLIKQWVNLLQLQNGIQNICEQDE